MEPQKDTLWHMECCSETAGKSVVLQLRDGTFAFQPAGAQVDNTHQSYGPQLQAPRCVIIFRKVLEGVYKQKCSKSLNGKWQTYEQLQREIVSDNVTTTKFVFFFVFSV